MVVRYIGDTHLYYCESEKWRNMSMDEYADDLLTKWNCITADDDLTYIVGDIGEYCPQTISILERLNGMKILVLGNHDYSWNDNILSSYFEAVVSHVHLKNIWVQHVPISTDNNKCFVVHAHHHNYDTAGMETQRNLYIGDRLRFNCAADLNGNKPCTLKELMINKERYIYSVLNV